MTAKRKRLDEFDGIFEEMERVMEKMLEDFDRPFVYGFSMLGRPGEKPELREFGNIRRGSEGFEIGEKRRPLVEVVDCNGELRVIAEMPGVRKGDIKVRALEKLLRIRGGNYSEDVTLPVKINTKSARATYRNGVLEVVVKKRR